MYQDSTHFSSEIYLSRACGPTLISFT